MKKKNPHSFLFFSLSSMPLSSLFIIIIIIIISLSLSLSLSLHQHHSLWRTRTPMLFLVGMMLLLVYTASLRPTPMLPSRSVSVSIFMAILDDEKGLCWFVWRMFFFFVLIDEKKKKKVNQYRIESSVLCSL